MGMKENAFAFIDAHRNEMLKMWEELVNIDSGSDYKPGVDKVVAKVADILTAMGGKPALLNMRRQAMPLSASLATVQINRL